MPRRRSSWTRSNRSMRRRRFASAASFRSEAGVESDGDFRGVGTVTVAGPGSSRGTAFATVPPGWLK